MGTFENVTVLTQPGGGAADVFGSLGEMSLTRKIVGVDPHASGFERTCLLIVHS